MAFEQGYALLIGVGTYAHHRSLKVPITVADAEEVKKVLIDPSLCGYPDAHVRLLHDDSANKQGVLDELEQLGTQIKPENTLTIFYAGHGAYGTDGNYYLTTHDTQLSDGKVVPGTGISEGELLEGLRKIKAKRLLLLFNACHAGEISPSLGGEAEESIDSRSLPKRTAEALLSAGEGRIILTACRPTQFSWFRREDKLTIFTQALVDGLSGKGGVASRQGYISAFNLYEHVYEAVKAAAKKLGETQEAVLTVLENVGPFPVALYRGEKEPGLFDRKEPLPENTAAQAVDRRQSLISYKQIVQIYNAQNVVIGDQYIQFIIKMGDFTPPPNLAKLRDDYLAYLERTHQALDFKGIPQLRSLPSELSLEEVYVPLLARPELPEGETWERRVAGRAMKREALPEEALQAMGQGGSSAPVQIEEALREKKRVVVLGDPGSGKSTLLKHLALRLAKDPQAPLPILLPLNAFAKALNQRAMNLQTYLAEYFKERAEGVAGLAPLFKSALAQGKAVILLDGLDEVQSERAGLVEKVQAFADEAILHGNRVLVTSRIVGYRDAPLTPNDWALYTLLDFTPAEIEAFAEKWCLAFERSTLGDTPEIESAAETERKALLAAIEANPGVARLAANPLLLTILALIKRQGVELPKSRIKLYDRYLETLIEAWNRVSALDHTPGRISLDYVGTLEVLGPLALRIREDNPTAGLVSEHQLQDWLTEHYTGDLWGLKMGPAREKAREFLESVRRYSNLLVERGEGQYGFIHLTFEEALAAYGLVAAGQVEFGKSLELIREHLTDLAWHETILLSMGVMGILQNRPLAAGKAVSEILKMDCTGEEACQNVLLAGACLEDVGEAGLGRGTTNDVIKALQEAVLNRKLPPGTQRDAGFVLGRLAGSSQEMLQRIRPDLDSFILITAGEFLYGEPPKSKRIKQPFEIAKYPVTNLQFKRFMDDKGYERQEFWSAEGWDWRIGKWDTKAEDYLKDWLKQRAPDQRSKPFYWNNRKWNNPLAPVVGVSWFEAEAYCCWLSAQLSGRPVRLPTEQEWERATRGVQGREYAWGNDIDRTRLNCAEFWAEKEDLSEYKEWEKWFKSPGFQNASITSVGQFPEGETPEGICDLSGNVWEWMDSWWDAEKVNRVVRGGSWNDSRIDARCACRYREGPDSFYINFGFRVVCVPI